MASESFANAGFVTISDGVYYKDRRGVAESTSPNGTNAQTMPPPQVVLIFGWMGAQLRHLNNYTRSYDKLYPNATQVLVRSEAHFWWMSARAKRRQLQSIADVLNSLGCLPLPKDDFSHATSNEAKLQHPRILTHVFSNGGAMQCAALGKLFATNRSGPSISPLAVSAIVLDSCPSGATFNSIRRAFTAAVPSPAVRYLAIVFSYGLHLFHSLFWVLSGKQIDRLEVLKRDLFNPHVLPWMDSKTPRLYIYSRGDAVIPWTQVEEHVNASKENGLNVHSELFQDSQHVAHMRANPERYWRAVIDVWERAFTRSIEN
ncbi:hypothetical protein BJ138DRAFT_1169779 [Hygrophoropsis aurantiaca]|uniref:Uncharacterized protein n=1 Tax=Hygrophoropsis aurantiaca TaxID=72124 RepID=A0ACB8AQU4_9AGAM|nr:hypothetical protein BJ138DRAFT_1169779 [Hygrophoropsis aurantiaca]